MDNVTHSLAGLLLAESALQLRARRSGAEPAARVRATVWVSSMIAANLPDADLFYTGVGGDRIKYLLHHRGYTHTIVAALAGAVMLWGIALLAWRWRSRSAPTRADSNWLLGLLLVSTISHLVLDWTNSYGLHPFWPVDDRWFYGDSVFIVEPWLWVASVPALMMARVHRVVRLLLSLILVVALALAWRVDLVSTGAAAALTVGAVLSVGLSRVLRAGARTAGAIALWVAVTLVMASGAAEARSAAVRATRAADPAAELLDVVVSPLPANPVCANVISLERSGTMYRVVTARVSAVPSMVDASDCGGGTAGAGAASANRRSTAAVRWDSEWSASSVELATLARESCPALAALRFIRAPIWRAADDSTMLLGDVRYGGAESGFSSVRVPRRSAMCIHDAPWTPPRADLLAHTSEP